MSLGRKKKYHQLSNEERVQFHATRTLYWSTIEIDPFEALRQMCLTQWAMKEAK
jgi:hypothetical protein